MNKELLIEYLERVKKSDRIKGFSLSGISKVLNLDENTCSKELDKLLENYKLEKLSNIRCPDCNSTIYTGHESKELKKGIHCDICGNIKTFYINEIIYRKVES